MVQNQPSSTSHRSFIESIHLHVYLKSQISEKNRLKFPTLAKSTLTPELHDSHTYFSSAKKIVFSTLFLCFLVVEQESVPMKFFHFRSDFTLFSVCIFFCVFFSRKKQMNKEDYFDARNKNERHINR